MSRRSDIIASLGGLWNHLPARRKMQLCAQLGLMLAAAFAEVVSLGAVLPFIAALTAPEQVMTFPFVASLAGGIGIDSPSELILPMTFAFAITALIAGAVRIVELRTATRLAYAVGADLGIEIFRRTLHQPYQVHISRNSSEVVSGVTRKVDGVVSGVLLQVLLLLGGLVVFTAILVALLFINWLMAMISAVLFGGSYVFITIVTRRGLRRNSKLIAREQSRVVRTLQEGLAGIRDVLLNGNQSYYENLYRSADIPLRNAQGSNAFLARYPRYTMESVGMILVAVLAFVFTNGSGDPGAGLPVLAALALGGQRMLPALQQTYGAWSTILGTQAVLDDTIALLDQPMPKVVAETSPSTLPFAQDIRFDDVGFGYEGSTAVILSGMNLVISRGARLGVIGPTGSGKSTMIDVLMGLLPPTSGELRVDGVVVNGSNVRAWQQNIAHVPQAIYLADASFAENIALGVPGANIDMTRVRRAAEQARIATFIEEDSQGYDRQVGENGARLSGGQRQRIGIARALYRRATLLVFDEATSALDSATEQSVMEAVFDLDPDLTVVMIAHRLSTLSRCTMIVELDKGQVRRQGGVAEMLPEINQ